MKNNSLRTGLLVAAVILLLFFAVWLLFSGEHYYRNTVIANAFVLPAIFGAGAFYSVMQLKRRGGYLGFREIYRASFLPMFIGGTVAFFAIFLFLNFGSPQTVQMLNEQYIGSFEQSLEKDYQTELPRTKADSPERAELNRKYEEGKIRLAEKRKLKENMFSARYFSYVYAGYLVFFLILSLFFASFFRSPRRE